MTARTMPPSSTAPALICLLWSMAWPHTSTMRKISGQASGTMLSSVSSWHSVSSATVS